MDYCEMRCPECGEALGMHDEVYLFDGGDTVVGCSLCIARHSAVEWHWAMEEMAADCWLGAGVFED